MIKKNISLSRIDHGLKREDFYSLRKNTEKECAHDWLTKLQEEAEEGETPKHLLPFSSDQESLRITLKSNKCTTCHEPKGKCQGFRINVCLNQQFEIATEREARAKEKEKDTQKIIDEIKTAFNMYNHLKLKHQKDLNLGGAENVEEVEEKCNSTSTGSSSESLKENNSRQIHNSPQKMMGKNPSSVVTNVVFNENELKNKSKTMENCEKEEMAVLEQLSGMQNLEMISLLHNPVVSKPNYRLFVIHKFSNLRVLDFKKVKQKEHDSTKELFKSKKGKEQFKGVVQVRIMRDWKGRKKKQKFLKN